MKKKVFFMAILGGLALPGKAQEEVTYQKPPQEILELADFERAPSLTINNGRTHMVFCYRNTYKTLDELGIEELRLAGLRINPNTNISSTMTYFNKLTQKEFGGGPEELVKGLPTNPKIANLSWSPDETKLAFTNTTDQGVELWVLDLKTNQAKALSKANLNANLGHPFTWYPNSEAVLARVLPSDRPNLISTAEAIPTGPTVSISEPGTIAQNITYQDLLQNAVDEKNFETLIGSTLCKIDLEGNSTVWKEKDQFYGETFSPDGKYVMVKTITRPYSYIVPLRRFPLKTTIYTVGGELVSDFDHQPLVENLPKGFMSTFTGKRSIAWRADQPATLYWVEAQDGGDPAKEVEFRDKVYQWEVPFKGKPTFLTQTINRYGGIHWGNDQNAILYDNWWDTRNTKTYHFNPAKPGSQPEVLFDRNSQDIYSNPGSFELDKNQYGKYTLKLNGTKAYLVGDGFRSDGQFPFVDEYNLKTQKTKRLFESNYRDQQIEISSIMNADRGEFLVRLQSPTEYPNYYILNTQKRIAPIALTHFKNPFEAIAGVHKEVITYKREDGVELSGTLYLPANYDKSKKEKLPMVMWAYPTEYKDKQSAGQISTNPNAFIYPFYGSPIYWVTRGYAVLDDAAFPIVGEGDNEPNDTFIEQLVANGKAAIDAVNELGYIDPDRVAVGGHSYGAFMTANLLSHCDLFAAGIARSGAYNRTLTPFGFQAEQRNYWDAPEVYSRMSPFMHADKMKTPLLLIHGADDNNAGTHTMQSERYFNALKGFGAPTRLVLLPKESHSYAAKESVLHTLWEQDQWLEKYVKNKKK